MAKVPQDQLYRLIKSMTKAEKRSFKLYVNRTMSDQERKFLVLFDLIDKSKDFDEELLRQKMPAKPSAGKLSNLKRHLFKQLLTSLRLSSIKKQVDIQIREQIDFAKILYTKGLYMESLRMLERTKQIAIEHHQDFLHLEIIEFQKLIEARHVTRSRQIDRKMENLLEEAIYRSHVTYSVSRQVNLNIQIHGYYIENGHAILEEDQQKAKEAWKRMKVEAKVTDSLKNTFFEKINRFEADMWYKYILMDLEGAKKYAIEWVEVFRQMPEVKDIDPDLFMRAYYYLLALFYLTDNLEKYEEYLEELKAFIEEYRRSLNPNSHNIGFVYVRLSRLNYFLLTKSYEEGYKYLDIVKNIIRTKKYAVDDHRKVLFYYKFAAFAFALGKYDEAMNYLMEIINEREAILRAELDISTRLLQLMCFYKNENFSLMGYRLTSLSRSLGKIDVKTHGQKSMLKLLKRLHKTAPAERKALLEKELVYFEQLEQRAIEKKSFKYLDITTWIKAELNGKTIVENEKG